MIEPNERMKQLPTYVMAAVDDEVEKLKRAGITPIDFGIGDPQTPTPQLIRDAIKEAVETRKASGYPSYIGAPEFRQTVAEWTKKRFSVNLDPDANICSSIGSKEAIFNFPNAFINPGDIVLVPNPGYPPWAKGTQFAGGKPHFINLLEENNFLPILQDISIDTAKRAKIMWVNYPNNPTTATAPTKFYKEAVDFGQDNNIIIASDEAYSETYYDEKPHSLLEFASEDIVIFQSLSKRSSMTGYRVGWVAGDENIIKTFKKIKTHVDSGTPTFIQDAAIAALNDENHVEDLRAQYRKKRDIMVKAFTDIGLPDCTPKATIYLWQKVNQSSVEFAKKLLAKEIGVVTTPGSWLSDEVNGVNPGENFIRLALVPTLEEVEQAAEKIRTLN